jgi:hypothetical protein
MYECPKTRSSAPPGGDIVADDIAGTAPRRAHHALMAPELRCQLSALQPST